MPIYAYKCTACGFAKDVLQKLSDAPLTVCPSCGQPRFAKQVTAASFQLKGSGWYVTDFRNEGSAPAADGKAAGNEGGTGAAPAPAAEAPAVAAPSPAPAPAPAPATAAGGSATT